MADVLFGDVNPGGKLPVTIPRNVGQLPIFYNAKPTARRGYLFDDVDAALPVRLRSQLHQLRLRRADGCRPRALPPGRACTVRVPVTQQRRKRAGDETVQVYVRDEVSSVTRPVKELVGLPAREHCSRAKRRMVDIAIRARCLRAVEHAT